MVYDHGHDRHGTQAVDIPAILHAKTPKMLKCPRCRTKGPAAKSSWPNPPD
ncbi:hypothetical protein RGUI_4224 (plasmid) [Rhodovulum sp. P5]|nr:hypothetical protein RGUI_4224 [Rhodovulum sp. P5]